MGLGLFPTYSLLNHSCICNTKTIKRVDSNQIHSLEVVATKDIKKGKSIICLILPILKECLDRGRNHNQIYNSTTWNTKKTTNVPISMVS